MEIKGKVVLVTGANRGLGEQFAKALQSHKDARGGAEAREGLAAFLEHREPMWPQKPN